MKSKIASIATSLLIALFSITSISAQKFGVVDTEKIISELPEVKQANSNIEALKAQLSKKGQDMVKSLQTKYQALQSKQNELSPNQIKLENESLQKDQTALQAFEQDSKDKIMKKSEELLAPVQERINVAIKAVATEKELSYIFDLSQGLILYHDDAVDVSSLVVAKMKTEIAPAVKK